MLIPNGNWLQAFECGMAVSVLSQPLLLSNYFTLNRLQSIFEFFSQNTLKTESTPQQLLFSRRLMKNNSRTEFTENIMQIVLVGRLKFTLKKYTFKKPTVKTNYTTLIQPPSLFGLCSRFRSWSIRGLLRVRTRRFFFCILNVILFAFLVCFLRFLTLRFGGWGVDAIFFFVAIFLALLKQAAIYKYQQTKVIFSLILYARFIYRINNNMNMLTIFEYVS